MSFAVLWFFITFLPVSNIVPIQNMMACRYLYLPMAGFSLLAALVFRKTRTARFIQKPLILYLMTGMMVALPVFYALLTSARILAWRSEITLRREYLQHRPDDIAAHIIYGAALERNGLFKQAWEVYKKAKDIFPESAYPCLSLSWLYTKTGHYPEAMEEFRMFLKKEPYERPNHWLFCQWLNELKRQDEWQQCMEEFRRLNPTIK